MKRLLVLVLVTLTSLAVYGQLDRDAMIREKMRANGIQEATQFTHKYVKGKPNKKGYKTSTTTYNKDGNPIQIINYRSNGQESSRLTYDYDEEGRRTEYRKEETLGGKSMKVSYRQQFTYDKNGNKRSEIGFDGTSNYRVIYNYLPNGRLHEITRYSSDNSVSQKFLFTYKKCQQIINVMLKHGDPYTIEKTFDKQQQLISEAQLDKDGIEQKRVEYSYDHEGRLVGEKVTERGNLREDLRYIYDDKGQLLKIMQRLTDGNERMAKDYAYDTDGNLVIEKWVDGAPELISKKENEFDSNGVIVQVDSYYAPYRYRVMYSYQYKKF